MVNLNKRGDISQPFTYLFGIIAGALILIFLISFAKGHVNIQTLKSSQESAFYFDETLTLLTAGEDVYKEINTPIKRNYEISCNNLIVEKSKPAKLNSIVFSPKKLTSQKLSVYSKSVLFPFKIANIFIISDPSKRYLFVFDDQTKDLVESFKNDIRIKLPSIFNFQLISKQSLLSNLNELTSQKITRVVIFAHFNNQELTKLSQKFKDILVVNYNEGTGTLKYISNSKDSNFFSLPLLYGAIFSEDHQSYECSRDLLLNKLKLLSKLYNQKASLLSSPSCPYQQASTILNTLDTSNLEALKSFYTSLEQVNTILAGGNCAPLY